jgi:hypothetical protein
MPKGKESVPLKVPPKVQELVQEMELQTDTLLVLRKWDLLLVFVKAPEKAQQMAQG